jgi:hypothetical protein
MRVGEQQQWRVGLARYADPGAERALLGRAPVVAVQPFAVGLQPGQVDLAVRVGTAVIPVRGQRQQALAQRDEARGEGDQRFVGARPVEPRRLVVLAVGVVVAALAHAQLVAGQQHRRALRQQQAGEQRALQPCAALEHVGIVGLAFDAAVRRDLVRMAVAVVLAVRLVALVLVGQRIAQREAVVRGDEVHRLDRRALPPVEQVRGAGQAARELAARCRAQPVAARAVAEAVVPFEPAAREVAGAPAGGADVPGLGDELAAGKQRVLRDGVEERRVRVEAVVAAPEHRRQVEAEAVDVQLGAPVTQRVQHHLQHARRAQVERVAAAGEVLVAARLARHRAIPVLVVQTAPAQRGAGRVALRGVVVDHVDDDLEAGRMQPRDHRAELVARTRRLAGVARLDGEVADGVVAPVVAQAALRETLLVEMLLHRQQAHRGNAEALQVRDRRVARQPGVGAAQRRGHAGMAHREAAYVQLVEHRVSQRRLRPRRRRAVMRGDDARLQRMRAVVARIGPAGRAVEVLVAPCEGADDLARVRVEQQLVRVEALAMLRVPRPVRAQAVHEPRRGAGHEAVPHVAAVPRQRNSCDLVLAALVVQAQLDGVRVRRAHGHVDAGLAVPRARRRAERPRPAGAQRGHRAAGSTPQTRVAYSRIVRSDENAPMPATLAMARRAHCTGSRYSVSTRACAAT